MHVICCWDGLHFPTINNMLKEINFVETGAGDVLLGLHGGAYSTEHYGVTLITVLQTLIE